MLVRPSRGPSNSMRAGRATWTQHSTMSTMRAHQMQTPPFKSPLGRKLQQRRISLGLSQAQLAERAELSAKYLGEVERGEANSSMDTLERLASALEWDPWHSFSVAREPITKPTYDHLTSEITSTRSVLQFVVHVLAALELSVRRSEDERTPPQVLAEWCKADGTPDRRRGPRTSGPLPRRKTSSDDGAGRPKQAATPKASCVGKDELTSPLVGGE